MKKNHAKAKPPGKAEPTEPVGAGRVPIRKNGKNAVSGAFPVSKRGEGDVAALLLSPRGQRKKAWSRKVAGRPVEMTTDERVMQVLYKERARYARQWILIHEGEIVAKSRDREQAIASALKRYPAGEMVILFVEDEPEEFIISD